MTSAQAVAIRDYLLERIEKEFHSTRRMLEAVPAEHLGWRPHESAMTMRELAWHIVESETLLFLTVERAGFEGLKRADPPADLQAMLQHYDREFPSGLARVRAMSGESLLKEAELFGSGGTLVHHLAFLLCHPVHHRGQLSTYLRSVGAFVPGMFGWSADERRQAAEKAAK